jgi:hypothetical protein
MKVMWEGKETASVARTSRIIHHYGIRSEWKGEQPQTGFWVAYRFARKYGAGILRSMYIAWGMKE